MWVMLRDFRPELLGLVASDDKRGFLLRAGLALGHRGVAQFRDFDHPEQPLDWLSRVFQGRLQQGVQGGAVQDVESGQFGFFVKVLVVLGMEVHCHQAIGVAPFAA